MSKIKLSAALTDALAKIKASEAAQTAANKAQRTRENVAAAKDQLERKIHDTWAKRAETLAILYANGAAKSNAVIAAEKGYPAAPDAGYHYENKALWTEGAGNWNDIVIIKDGTKHTLLTETSLFRLVRGLIVGAATAGAGALIASSATAQSIKKTAESVKSEIENAIEPVAHIVESTKADAQAVEAYISPAAAMVSSLTSAAATPDSDKTALSAPLAASGGIAPVTAPEAAPAPSQTPPAGSNEDWLTALINAIFHLFGG